MARSTVKTKGCFEAAIGLTDAEARAIEKIAEAKGFKTTNTNNDYYRATAQVLEETKAKRNAIIEQIAKLDPQAAQAYSAVKEQPAQAGNDDLDAMFDEIVAKESVNEAPKAPRAPRAPRATSDVPEAGFGKTTAPRAPRTAGEAAKSAAKNAASGIANTIDALGALFSTKPGTLGSGPVFNEDTYAAAKPLFAQAVADLKASGQDIREVMQAVIRMVMAKFGGDTVAQMKPYIVKFTQEVRDGLIDIAQLNTENEAEYDGSGTQGGKDGSRGSATGDLFDTAGEGVQDEQSGELPEDAATVRRGSAKSNTSNASRGTNKNAPPDYVPPTGGLTREGSWFETAKRNIDLIELAIQIESEDRPATPAEQERLAKYVGFGASAIRNELFPVPPAYAKAQEPTRLIWPQYVRSDRFKPLAERIEALPREWQQSILQSSQYAHYTSEGIIRSVWSALQRMGFMGGQVFEPGMGIGSFSMLMPDAIRAESRYTGVEFDAPTALIAKLLSPQQNMLHGDFIKGKYPKNFFDVNVGNPPFSQTKIFGDPEYAKKGFMLHDFFFAKGIDLVRPGGIQVFVTSKGTMDKQTDKARKYLSERADLLGAIRLPSTAFEDNAGTSVVTDVIFLRKRLPGEAPAGESWANTATVDTPDGPVVVNEYFAKHPEMVLGQQRISGNTDDQGRRINSNGMGGEKYTVVSYDATPAELESKFAKAIEKLPEGAYSEKQGKTEKAKDARVDFDPSVKREGVVYLAKDGTLMRVTEGVGVPLANTAKLSDKDQAWFKSYVGLRDLVQDARFAQLNDGDWEAALSKLNKAHNKFVKDHGNILDYRVMTRKSTDEEGNVVETESRIPKNRRLLREDYDQALVTSLESISEDGSIVKSPFLKGRTIGKPVTREVKSVGDALAVSLDETGHFDLADVGNRLNLDEEEAIEALGNQIYQTPDGEWQLADEYLSGDVVAKLEEAEAAARINPDLKRNVEALKEAQPEKLGPAQISAKLGASWIPESHVNEFSTEIGAGQVTFDPRTETWQVDGGNKQSGRMAGAEYGTAKRSPSELLEAILNSRSIKITQTIDKKTVPDQEGTTAANEMAKKIKDKFKGWVWTDTERATELVESYNKNFNNLAPRKFDGSHLTLPGVSLRYKLHPHQLRAIWRMVQTGNTYLAHAVGAGKTIEMIAGGMEQKRLGLIKKPMYVVPNHMLEQFSNEFMELYPLANIMVADDENFSPERRKAFIASATLNNPDAIVITHDAFQRIGVKEESVAPIRDEILADLEIELSETAKGNDTRVRRGQLEQQIEAVKQRFDRIIGAGAKDSTIKFEDMGVDFVFADEAHVFRKLDFHTAQQIKGIDPNGSKRALDMYVKTRILDKRKPGRSMVFASGTPVTNTMGELYTIMRFFAGAELDKSGISTFDAWARQFGEVAPALEPNAAGKYELIERFAKFDNVPELMSRVRQFMDVLTSDNLGALVKRPDIIGGKPNLNIIPINSDLTDYMKGELARRIEISRKWKPSKDEPHNPDPIVAIITDGRFAAIDPRFFGGALEEGDKSIITEMGDKVAASYHATKNDVYLDKEGNEEKVKGSTQIVFYNLGFGEQSQKNRGFNSRAAFTKRLTDGGIPRAEIAWFDDANSDAKKEAVFKAMRNGTIKVLIGSAKKMGTGVNVQKRLAVLHYQDPPWFPADVEQPHGRILRQGNQNEEIAIEWYTTKGTYQSTMWQMVGRKQRFIDQAFTGDKTLRSMDDLGEASLFEQAAAVASGDPRAIQLAGLKQDVERFTRLQAAHANEQINVRSSLNSALWQIESGQKSIKTLEKAFKAIGEKYFSFSSGKVDGRDYFKPGEFGQAIKDKFNKVAADSVMGDPAREVEIARIGDAIKVTMDAYIGKGNKPDGTFDIYVEFGGSSYQLGNASAMGADVDAAGLARRIFNKVNEVDSDLQKTRRALASNETDAIKLRKKLGAPFEYQQEMAEKYGELKRLEVELEAEGKATPAPNPFVVNADGSTAGEVPESSTNIKQTGAPEANATDVAFSRATGQAMPDVSDERTGISVALLELGKKDWLYQSPISSAKTVQQIARDKGVTQVREDDIGGGVKEWKITLPDTTVSGKVVRGRSAYLRQKNGELWIDAEITGEGRSGSKLYDIGFNYAHNNPGLVFIGDRHGFSPAAMTRRLHNMISAAVKYGSTDFMAPHAKQVMGFDGVPGFRWEKGDTLGNLRRMIDVAIKITENQAPIGSTLNYDAANDTYTSGDGQALDARGTEAFADFDPRGEGKGGPGVTTLKRVALFKSLLRSAEERRGFLERLDEYKRSDSQGVGSPLEKAFYARGESASPVGLSAARVTAIADAIKATWKNSPEIVVAASMDDEAIPANVRAYNQKQMSLGATGSPQGFIYGGKVYLIADQLSTPGHVVEVLFHEALGHIGLRGVFGKSLEQVLNQVILARRAEVLAKAKQYGLSESKPAEMRQAAEEVLAEMAQAYPELGIVQRAIAAIRTWLRENIPQLKSMALTDSEVIRNFILPARAHIERGSDSWIGGMTAFARRYDAGSDIPNVIIGNPIGSGKVNEDYQAAKAGDIEAAVRLAKVLVTPNLLERVSAVIGSAKPIVVGVASIEATGKNRLPNAAARVIGHDLGLDVADDIIQSTSPKRTSMNGLDRIFNTPEFDGAIESGRSYLLIDDTVTQGATFAALASHIKDGGGKIAGVVALTGKEYSATIKPSPETLSKLREKYADLESTFKAETGYGFDGLTQSEARYLANFEPAVTVRNRIIEAGQQANIEENGRTAGELDSSSDSGKSDIRFSRSATLSATANKVVDKLNEHFSHPGTMSWWHKSFGSPYNLAQKSRPFKRVFTSAQDFLNDVSFYANEAADHAAKLLPKLEHWKDIFKSPISAEDNKAIEAPIFEGTLIWARDESGKPVKVSDLEAKYDKLGQDKIEEIRQKHKAAMAKLLEKGASSSDIAKLEESHARDLSADEIRGHSDEAKAQMLLRKGVVTEAQLKRWKASQLDIYSGAIRNRFEATYLRPGVAWTDAELKSIFNLTPEQSDLYRQFHEAVGTSLDNMAKSEMLRYGGKDVEALRGMVLDSASADDAAILLRDHLLELSDEEPGRASVLTDMANGMVDRADKVNKLKKEGYAPLSRFGQYSVDVVVDGERQYFGLFETMADANQMADKMREEYGAENVESGTMAQAKFELYKGITPESLELFGNMLGLDSTGDKESDKVFQEYLKLTKNNRSAMKRLIHRKGIAGYSTDTGRVLAAFIYSNARQTAAGLHMGEMSEALEAMPKLQGQLSDYATKYADYVKNPQEEAQAIRGLMFAQYLGGNVASAFVNFTQPMTVSFPYLSQFAGAKGAAAAIGKAMADQRKAEYDDDLKEALRIADEQGVTQPQSVHELQAQARGAATLRSSDGTRRGAAIAMASNAVSKFSLGWGKLFGMAEQINRRTTFIAAYRIAVEKGIANPSSFATKAVDETQFINNKGNRATAARGAIGSTAMTFKSYSINYMELLHRMATQGGPEGKRAVALAMVMLFLMAGAGGLPFMEDLDDLIDGIAQRMGYNFSTKKAKQEFLEHWIGKAGAQFVDRGLTGIAGVPIDVAGRMGMGNLLPGTGLFMPKADHSKDLLEFAGVGADMASRYALGAGQFLDGRFIDSALTVAPKAIGNAAQGIRMGSKGYYEDSKGAKVIDTTPTEAAFKSIGFQPKSVALVGQSNWIMQSGKNLYNLRKQSIQSQWAKGLFEGDKAAVESARAAMQEWNQQNPEAKMQPNMPSIIHKVKEMRKTKEQRIADTAPKAMKAELRREIAENHQP